MQNHEKKKNILLTTIFSFDSLLFTSSMQTNPDPSCCLGVFGLSLYTTERDLREVFSKYGPLSDVSIVHDQQSRRSRGFAFVYFENRDDAKEVSRTACISSFFLSGWKSFVTAVHFLLSFLQGLCGYACKKL